MPKILRYYLEQEEMSVFPHGTRGHSVHVLPGVDVGGVYGVGNQGGGHPRRTGSLEVVSPLGEATVDAQKNKTAWAHLLQALPEDILIQVFTKKTAKEVWESLKMRFVSEDRVKTARLATLKGEFDKLCMTDGETLDVYGGRINDMATKFAGLRPTLDNVAMVKKLLDTVPDHLYPAASTRWHLRRRSGT